MKTYGRFFFVTATAMLALAGCGSDSTTPAAFNVNGVWDVSESILQCNCTSCDSSSYTVTVTQSGNKLTVAPSTTSQTFTGTMNGDVISWDGTIKSGEATINVSMSLTVTDNGAKFTGTSSWTYSEPGYSCSGQNKVEGTRQGGANTNPIPGTNPEEMEG
ncbi:MAG: hypothetical protein GXP54_13175 [Deltaproteobacteria bacterium]|nr:hypothetical protein [Deltaproteobacteria bacterium]